jgi:hypothetical protein
MKVCTASTCLGVGRSGRLTRTIARIRGGFWAQSMRIPTRSAFCPRVMVSLRRLASIACSTCSSTAVRRAWRSRLRKLPLSGSNSREVSTRLPRLRRRRRQPIASSGRLSPRVIRAPERMPSRLVRNSRAAPPAWGQRPAAASRPLVHTGGTRATAMAVPARADTALRRTLA